VEFGGKPNITKPDCGTVYAERPERETVVAPEAFAVKAICNGKPVLFV
jgi:hypothetical protein